MFVSDTGNNITTITEGIKMSDIVEVNVEVTGFTELAIQVLDLNDNTVWIPRSQIDDYTGEDNDPESIFITQWLAEEKGIV